MSRVNGLEEDNNYNNVNLNEINILEWNESKDRQVEFTISNDNNIITTQNTELSTYSDIERFISNDDRNGILLHNSGDAIETNLDDLAEGNSLVAIYIDEIDGQEFKSYYYSDKSDNGIGYIDEFVVNNIDNEVKVLEENPTINPRRNINMSFSGEGVVRATISSTIEGTRKGKTPNKESVWDIKATTQLKMRVNKYSITQQRTRLSVQAYGAENLVDWAPDKNDKPNTTVSLSGLLSPENWKFEVNGFKFIDKSDKYYDYGRWEFNSNLGALMDMKTKPGIRATNTKGNMAVDVSFTANLSGHNHGTGVIPVYFNDSH